jgi:hypothetical protein
MSNRWRFRIAAMAGLWIATVVVMAVMDMRPAVTVLAAVAIAIASILWLLLDLGDLAAPVDWRAYSDGGASMRGADARVRVLRRQISDGRALDGSAALQRSLVSLVDDLLATSHGVDRVARPTQAATVLGPRLQAFVDAPVSGNLLAHPERLAAILDEIERLADPSRPLETR